MPVHPPGRPPATVVRALQDLTIEVGEGEIFGFLGPNGAGKSTTIRLLLGFLHPTTGRASVLGLDAVRDSVAIRSRVGYLPGGIAFWDGLTGERLLDDLAALSGRPPTRRAELARPARAVAGDPPAPGPRLLARDAPEARRHPGAPARPGAGDPRRADRGPRPAHAVRLLFDPRGPAAVGPDDLLLVAHPVRGRARVRPRGDRPARPARRARGHPDLAGAPQAQRRDAARRAAAGARWRARRIRRSASPTAG